MTLKPFIEAAVKELQPDIESKVKSWEKPNPGLNCRAARQTESSPRHGMQEASEWSRREVTLCKI